MNKFWILVIIIAELSFAVRASTPDYRLTELENLVRNL